MKKLDVLAQMLKSAGLLVWPDPSRLGFAQKSKCFLRPPVYTSEEIVDSDFARHHFLPFCYLSGTSARYTCALRS